MLNKFISWIKSKFTSDKCKECNWVQREMTSLEEKNIHLKEVVVKLMKLNDLKSVMINRPEPDEYYQKMKLRKKFETDWCCFLELIEGDEENDKKD